MPWFAARNVYAAMSSIPIPTAIAVGEKPDHVSVELSSRRTDMSFLQTRMTADQTLMSVIRTSLTLMTFGFAMYEFFTKLTDQKMLTATAAPRNFGSALVYLGVGMIAVGIAFHVQFMWRLRRERQEMRAAGLLHDENGFPLSFTLVVAVLLLLLGVGAIVSVSFGIGPFQ
jgi:putative membrane protein